MNEITKVEGRGKLAGTRMNVVMPTRSDLFYGGRWQPSKSGKTVEIYNPSTERLGAIRRHCRYERREY